MSDANTTIGSVLVVGGGVGGMQAALDLAEAGYYVYLVEKKPMIGGVMAQLDKTFPTNDCAMCMLAPRLVAAGRHKNIKLITNADLETVTGNPGRFTVAVNVRARSVNEEKCTGCGTCVANCPIRHVAHIDRKPLEVTLPPDVAEKVDRILARHEAERGPLMPVLQDISAELGYLPPDVLKYVAGRLRLPLSRIYNIATFYSAFSLTPKGRHIIQVCAGTTCYVRGAEGIIEAISKEIGILPGQVTKDRRFSLETVRCIGCCSLAPVIRIGDKTFGRLKQRDIPGILGKFT